MGSLDGKVAFVTGASRGLGRGMALQIAKAGAAVVCAARATDEQRSPWFEGTIDATANEIRAFGGHAPAVQMDVTREDDIERAFKHAFAEFGRIDFLINNAGVGFMGTVAELSVKRWDVVMNVNLRGAYLCCKQVLDHMIERRSGHVVNISSAVAAMTGPGLVAYGAAKAALERFSVGLAAEVAEYGVAVNALRVAGEGAQNQYYEAEHPRSDGAKLDPPEVSGAVVVWLLEQDAAAYNGRVLDYAALRDEHGIRPR